METTYTAARIMVAVLRLVRSDERGRNRKVARARTNAIMASAFRPCPRTLHNSTCAYIVESCGSSIYQSLRSL